MTVLRIRAEGLANTRFALSPFAETLMELLELHWRHPPTGAWAWLRRDPVAAGLFGLLRTTKYFPDFIGLPPSGLDTRIDDELARLRAVPDDVARAQVREAMTHSWEPHATDWLDVAHLCGRIADVFERAWSQEFEADWPRRRIIMERDIRYRAGLLATGGWQAAILGMGRHVEWVPPDGIRFSTQRHPDREITEAGLRFVPHTGTSGSWTCEYPPGMALVYPARGGALAVGADDGVASLLGPTRARILRDLETPATPSQLAHTMALSLGTIAAHLARLEAAGTLTRTRHGRAVYYQRTARGDALAALLGEPA